MMSRELDTWTHITIRIRSLGSANVQGVGHMNAHNYKDTVVRVSYSSSLGPMLNALPKERCPKSALRGGQTKYWKVFLWVHPQKIVGKKQEFSGMGVV